MCLAQKQTQRGREGLSRTRGNLRQVPDLPDLFAGFQMLGWNSCCACQRLCAHFRRPLSLVSVSGWSILYRASSVRHFLAWFREFCLMENRQGRTRQHSDVSVHHLYFCSLCRTPVYSLFPVPPSLSLTERNERRERKVSLCLCLHICELFNDTIKRCVLYFFLLFHVLNT